MHKRVHYGNNTEPVKGMGRPPICGTVVWLSWLVNQLVVSPKRLMFKMRPLQNYFLRNYFIAITLNRDFLVPLTLS
jgi:hypothetical protein